MPEKRYRVAIIGCGGMGRSHARAFQNHPRTEVVAAMDINPDAVNRMAEEFSVPGVYLDRKRMFESEDLDIVDVCTWQSVRAEITIDAAENTDVVGIFGEKPMCASVGEAEDMMDELKSRPMLGAFRGQEPADLETICRSAVALGNIGLEQEQIAEIDINPMIIDRKGRVKAADALVVLTPQEKS